MNEEPFAAIGGRKFLVTLLGMGLCTLLPLASAFLPAASRGVAEAIGAIGAMTLAYNGANTAVSWVWAKNSTTNEMVERGGKAIEDGDVL